MKSHKFNFRPNLLSLSVASILGLTATSLSAAEADEAAAEDEDVEVIQVTGIRGSMIRAMDIKRESNGVVDAISAEDMGKFPDTNLAESLQRITGVSIDRQNGEGSKVTVRGFGPAFNVVTLNGRQMPAANINATSASSDRSFNFADIASEGVAGVQIYKTARSKNPTGGIGAVINIETTKPLNNPGMQSTIGVKGVIDESNEDGDSITPEISGLYSNTFADDKFGVAISGSYQKRDSGFATGGANSGWTTQTNGLQDANGNQDIPVGAIFSYPVTMMYSFNEVERTRTNGQLTFQYRPIESLTATLDYTYSENEVETKRQELSTWFNDSANYVDGEWSSITNGAGQEIYTPLYINDASVIDFGQGTGEWGTSTENKSIGLNLEWQVNDNLVLALDYHDSESEITPTNALNGTNNAFSVVSNNRVSTTVDFTNDLPAIDVNCAPDDPCAQPSKTLPSGSFFRNAYMKNEISQLQVDGTYTFDDGIVTSVDFGISSAENEVRTAFSNSQDNSWGGIGTPDDYDDSIFETRRVEPLLNNIPHNGTIEQDVLFTSLDDIRAVATPWFEDNNVTPGTGGCGFVICANPNYDNDSYNKEELTSAYVQLNLSTDIADMPLNVVVGVRYEDTDISSTSANTVPDLVVWNGDNEFSEQQTGNAASEASGGYDHTLPSIDLDLEVVEDVIARASWGKSITRPNYGQVNGGITPAGILRNNGQGVPDGNASSGVPDLLPYESTNIDLSVEWYYDEGSYISAGYYRKDVEEFIGTVTNPVALFDARTPVGGPRWLEAVASGKAYSDNAGIRDYFWENDYDTVPGVGAQAVDADGNPLFNADGSIQYEANDPLNGDIHGVAADPLAVYNYQTPANFEELKIDGFEVAVQHIFGDSGFGTIVNYTTVDGDVDYDRFDLGTQFTVPGLSDSANFIGFYDKDGVQVRVAYNWRDEFLVSTLDQNGGNNPIFTEAYGQWDVNASYDFNDNLTVFVEAINVTDEYTRNIGRTDGYTDLVTQTGPRYNIGARYTF